MFGKQVSDLQSNITISGNVITGTLNYVDDYTGFSSVVSSQSGNYLALKIASVPSDAVITVEVVGGDSGPVELDDDRNIVLRIRNTATQSIKVIAEKDGSSLTKTYQLTGLTLATE